jgi:hypothetical protein
LLTGSNHGTNLNPTTNWQILEPITDWIQPQPQHQP